MDKLRNYLIYSDIDYGNIELYKIEVMISIEKYIKQTRSQFRHFYNTLNRIKSIRKIIKLQRNYYKKYPKKKKKIKKTKSMSKIENPDLLSGKQGSSQTLELVLES